jgi:hypothetical protein
MPGTSQQQAARTGGRSSYSFLQCSIDETLKALWKTSMKHSIICGQSWAIVTSTMGTSLRGSTSGVDALTCALLPEQLSIKEFLHVHMGV